MKISESRRRILRVLWFLAILCVVVGSLLPGSSGPIQALGELPVSDKVIHFSSYVVLAFLPMVIYPDRRKALLAALSMIALGILLEGGQWITPDRDVEFGDVVANTLGVLTGILAGLPLR